MSITNTSTDLLARFLPVHSDARLVSHYLALLAENEFRLKEQLRQAQDDLRQHAQIVCNVSPSEKNLPHPEKPKPCHSIANSLYKLGMHYFNGDEGCPVDLTKAISMFEQALEWSHPEAEIMLAECHYFSENKPDFLEKALEWYIKAADKGHPDGLYSVGYMYHYGEGTKTDKKKALDFLKKAATAGSSDAQKMLFDLSHS